MKLGSSGGLDRLKLVDLPDPPAPGTGEIQVRVHGSSLNFHDYAVVRFDAPYTVDRIPMADGAGVVEAVGPGVTEFAPGDAVVSVFFPQWPAGQPVNGDFTTVPGDGVDGYARERVVRPAHWFTKAPRGWSAAQSATLTTAGVTAWRALVGDGGLKAGDTVLVLGTGGVAIFGLQLAKAMGASVILTSSSDEKLARARALGADHTLNYRSTPEWGAEVAKLTAGRGVDHVLELGGPGTLPQSIAACRIGGHISLIGVLTGFAGQVPTAAMMRRQIRLQGLIVGSREQQQEMVSAMNTTGIRPVIDRCFALADLAEAFRYEESNRHFGKICLEF
ncbi:MAG TPA: NAD(P)-dependent alcohol dehydrogenase [Steroidobacteraceae bacterium]|nr:NAD(P)-dependent alcohol dehydrogenase [Steroidobacteraceae bacterium]